jgi:hypothetical protein
MHTDPRVRRCSLEARYVLAWLMGGPARSSLPGLVAIGPAGLGEAIGINADRVHGLLAELEREGLVQVDATAPLMCVPDSVHWDGKPNPKVLKAWGRLLGDLPTSPLIAGHVAKLVVVALASCPEAEVAATLEPFANSSAALDSAPIAHRKPTDRGVQSGLPSRARAASSSAPSSASAEASTAGTHRGWRRVPPSWEPNDDHRKLANELNLIVDNELAMFRDHEFAKPKKDADATFSNWLRRASGYHQSRGTGRTSSKQGDHGLTGFEALGSR